MTVSQVSAYVDAYRLCPVRFKHAPGGLAPDNSLPAQLVASTGLDEVATLLTCA